MKSTTRKSISSRPFRWLFALIAAVALVAAACGDDDDSSDPRNHLAD